MCQKRKRIIPAIWIHRNEPTPSNIAPTCRAIFLPVTSTIKVLLCPPVLMAVLFSGCHWHVDPEAFYKDCLFDMCSCKVDLESCLCPTLAAYAKECAAAGISLLWRHNVDECKIHCPGSQVYQICGNSCTR